MLGCETITPLSHAEPNCHMLSNGAVCMQFITCRLCKHEYQTLTHDVSLQAIHHKAHFLINSSLQACQDSSKGPIQPQALLALCCSLQVLEVRSDAPPSCPMLNNRQTNRHPE